MDSPLASFVIVTGALLVALVIVGAVWLKRNRAAEGEPGDARKETDR